MSTYQTLVTIRDRTQIDEVPPLRAIEGGPWRCENPGVFEPGVYVVRVNVGQGTARIEASP